MSDAPQTFPCPNCGQEFPLLPEYAGRKLGCACGAMVEIPEPPATETYDLQEEPAPQALKVESLDDPPPGKLALDSEGNEVIPIPPAAPAKVLNYRRTGAIEQPTLIELGHIRFRDLYVPIVLIGISIIGLALLAAVVLAWQPFVVSGSFVLKLGFRAIWDIAMTLVAGMVIYGFIDSGIGEMHTAILKLVAMGLLRFTISAIVAPDSSFGLAILGFFMTFPMILFMFHYFFEFELGQSMLCTLILSFMRVTSYFGLWKLL